MKTMNPKCGKKECTNTATYSIHLSLAVHSGHDPAISTPIVHVCEEHIHLITWEEWIEPNWERICKSVESIGRVAPVKKFSKLITKPLLANGTNNTGGHN